MPGSSEPRPQCRTGGGPPRALGAGAHGLGQRTGKAVYSGKEGSSSAREGTRGRRQPGGVMHEVRKPAPGRTPAARPPGSAQKTLPTRRHLFPPRPIPRASPSATKFLSAQRAAQLTWESGHKRAEPEEAGVQKRRDPRHGGGARPHRRRGQRTLRGRASRAEARRPRAGGCSRIPRTQPGLTAPAAGREEVAAALARALPPPSLPQRSQPSPGAAAALARRPGRLGCRRSGRPRRAALAGEGLAQRYRRNLDSGTGPALRLPRAPAHSALRLRPFPSSLQAARLHFPPLLPPSLLSPSRPPPGCHTVSLRRGGAGRGELPAGPAPPRAGTGRDTRPRAPRWQSLPEHLGRGSEVAGQGLGSAFTAAGRYGKPLEVTLGG